MNDTLLKILLTLFSVSVTVYIFRRELKDRDERESRVKERKEREEDKKAINSGFNKVYEYLDKMSDKVTGLDTKVLSQIGYNQNENTKLKSQIENLETTMKLKFENVDLILNNLDREISDIKGMQNKDQRKK
jgi:cbb3-type cytochrome oxidase subunit 3